MRYLFVISLSLCFVQLSAQRAQQQVGVNILGAFGFTDQIAETAMSRSFDLRYQWYLDNQTFLEFSGGYELLRSQFRPDIERYRCSGAFARASVNIVNRADWFFGGIGIHLARQNQQYTVVLGGDRFPSYLRDFENQNTPVSLYASVGFKVLIRPRLTLSSSFELYRSMITRSENTERIYHVSGAGAGLNPSHKGALISTKINLILFYRLFPE